MKLSPEWQRTIVAAVVLGLVAAVVVWFLEDFQRRRLTEDWQRFIQGWAPQPPGTHGPA